MPYRDSRWSGAGRWLGSVRRFAAGTIRHGRRFARADGAARCARRGCDDSTGTKFFGWPAESGWQLARDYPTARRYQLRSACLYDGVGHAGVAGNERVTVAADVRRPILLNSEVRSPKSEISKSLVTSAATIFR